MLQDTLDQSLQEPGSVQGRLWTGLLSLSLKTAKVETIFLEMYITTDRAKTDKTMQEKTEGLTSVNRKMYKAQQHNDVKLPWH